MELKSIKNDNATNIDNCESEPIHIPGSIQPHGFLLAIDREQQIVRYGSANTESFLKIPVIAILNQPLQSVWKEAAVHLAHMLHENNLQKHPAVVDFGNDSFLVLFHRAGNLILLECEPNQAHTGDMHQWFDQTSQFVSIIERSRSLKELCQNIANDTRSLTGYDRVMIYRFDKNYNGEVYAESKREDLDPFLGLHYPHTDIPAQARELYRTNLLRIVVDVEYEPVPILTLEAASHASVDLSDVKIRSVSPIHIQYLKNLGVAATLTISLLQDGKLWGLIACHHCSPKNLSYAQRQGALLQGHFLSSQIKVRQVAEEYEVNVAVEAHLQQLLNSIEADEDFEQKFENFTSLLAVTNASGAVILHNGQVYEKGLVPPREKVLALISWIDRNIKSIQFSTASLVTRYPEAESISRYASGIFYHALGKPTENCVIWFREEMEKTINWAGNPNHAVQKDEQTKSLTPRRSFAVWKELVRFQSREWRVSERNAAMRFATALQSYFHLVHLNQEEMRLRFLNDKLQKANKELSNINWITTHDLKEPLRKIQLFASRIVENGGEDVSDQIRNSIHRIHKSAGRMRQLVDDITAYSLTDHSEQVFAVADLNAILEDVKEDLVEEIEKTNAHLEIHLLPQAVKVVPYQIQQLFYNLLSNSLKFTMAEMPLRISVTCQKVSAGEVKDVALHHGKDYYNIHVQDNGIGFDPSFNQRVFDIFYRLHAKEEYDGTGIGLAICKKIMENHNGAITAYGEQGKGARFSIFLPTT